MTRTGPAMQKIPVQALTAVRQAIVGQGLDRTLVARTAVDQHVTPAEGWNRTPGVVDITAPVAARTVRAEAAVAPQIQPLADDSRRRPVLGVTPVIGDIAGLVRNPGTGRIQNRRLIRDPGRRILEPVVKPLEVGIAWPEVTLIHKVVAVGSDPQALVSDAGLNVAKGGQHAGQKNVEPGGDVKTGHAESSPESCGGRERRRARGG